MSETVNGKVGGTHSLNNSSTHPLIGRVASLLEVGTGFHPELTGRENVYFNGAIVGMRKAEIDNKFDEIVDFKLILDFKGREIGFADC